MPKKKKSVETPVEETPIVPESEPVEESNASEVESPVEESTVEPQSEPKVEETAFQSADIFDKEGQFVRTYRLDVHGPDFVVFAKSFSKKIGGTAKFNS